MRHVNRRRRIDEEKTRKYLGTAAIHPFLVKSLRNDQGSLSIGPYQYRGPAIVDRSEFNDSLLRARLEVNGLEGLDGEVMKLDFEPGTRIQSLQEITDDVDPISCAEYRNERCLVKLYSSGMGPLMLRELRLN